MIPHHLSTTAAIYHLPADAGFGRKDVDLPPMGYLSSVFSELARLGEWTAPNPLESMRKFTIAEKEMAWLTHEQITELLYDCQRQSALLALVVKICLSTGARWREAVNLTRSQVTKYRITYVRTKGKKTAAFLSVKSCMRKSLPWTASSSLLTATFSFYP